MSEPKPSKPKLACRLKGHQWQGTSLIRTCKRCGKRQKSNYCTTKWQNVGR